MSLTRRSAIRPREVGLVGSSMGELQIRAQPVTVVLSRSGPVVVVTPMRSCRARRPAAFSPRCT